MSVTSFATHDTQFKFEREIEKKARGEKLIKNKLKCEI